MPVSKKSVSLLNLEKYRVWIEDSGFNSDYFKLTEVPDTLTGGRNAFLILGSKNLIPSTDVLVEITDANGDTIFNQPIRNFQEGISRLVTIEIYEDTVRGPATLTIMGELAYDKNGNPTPDEWKGKYNVKWTKTLNIDPLAINTTKIRLARTPTVAVQEILSPYREATYPATSIVTGSPIINGVVNVPGFAKVGQPDYQYLIQAASPLFSSSMEDDGQFSASISSNSYRTRISKVLSQTTAIVQTPFTSSTGLYQSFATTDYTLSWVDNPTYQATQFTRSFAEVNLSQLTTLSGDIARARIYVRSVDQPGNYELLDDVRLEETQLLTTRSYESTDFKIDYGDIINQSIINQYWTAGIASSKTGYSAGDVTASYSTLKLMDSMRISNIAGISSLQASEPRYYIGLNTSVPFDEGSSYTVTFNAFCSKSVSTNSRIDVYLSGSAFADANPLGKLVTTLYSSASAELQSFFNQTYNISAPRAGTAKLQFVVWGGDWSLADIGVDSARESGFNPDQISVIAPIVGRRFERLQFKIELYDNNGNLVPVLLETLPIFFNGGNVVIRGKDNRFDGKIIVAPSGSGAVLGVDESGSYVGVINTPSTEPDTPLPKPVHPSDLNTYTGPSLVTIYSGSNPFTGSQAPLPALGIQGILDGNSYFDFNSVYGFTFKGPSIVLETPTFYVNGGDPRLGVIAVGGPTASTMAYDSGAAGIYMEGQYTGRLRIGEPTGSHMRWTGNTSTPTPFTLFISGTVAVESGGIYHDVRDLIAGAGDSASLAAQATAYSAALAAQAIAFSSSLSAQDNFYSQSFSQSLAALSGAMSQQDSSLTQSISAVSNSLVLQDNTYSSSLSQQSTTFSASLSAQSTLYSSSISQSIVAVSNSLVNQDKSYSASLSQQSTTFSASLSAQTSTVSSSLSASIAAVSNSLVTQDKSYSSSLSTQSTTFSASLSAQSTLYSSSLSSSIASVSNSLVTQDKSYSSSLSTQSVTFSASLAAAIGSVSGASAARDVVDAVNRIKLPDVGLKSQSGLYLEQDVMGYYSASTGTPPYTNRNFPVIISASGEFRFADQATWNGTEHTNVVGFVGGNFLVRSNRILIQTAGDSTSGLQILGVSGSNHAGNSIRLGPVIGAVAAISGAAGSGVYMDGVGNFFVGSGSLLNGGQGSFISYTPTTAFGSQLNIRSQYLTLSSSGLFMAGSGSANSAAVIRLGPVITAISNITGSAGSGFYADGAGNLFVGSGSVAAGGNYIFFDSPNGRLYIRSNYLHISSSGLQIQSTGSGTSNYIRLGDVIGAIASISASQGSGFYVDGAGNMFIGSGTLANGGQGSFISYTPSTLDGSQLNIRSQYLNISSSGLFIAGSGSANSAAVVRLGNIQGLAGAISGSSGSGFYADGAGNVFVGSGSLNQGGQGTYISYNPSINALMMKAAFLNISSSGLFINASGSLGEIQNQIHSSEDFIPDGGTPGWSRNSIIVNDDVALAPDGTMTAALISAISGSWGIHGPLLRDIIHQADIYFRYSIYVSASGTSRIGLYHWNDNTSGMYRSWFDVNTFTIYNSASSNTHVLSDVGMQDAGNGWWRLWIAGKVSSSCTHSHIYQYIPSGSNDLSAYSGSETQSLYMWGAMLQFGDINGPPPLAPYLRTTITGVTASSNFNSSIRLGDVFHPVAEPDSGLIRKGFYADGAGNFFVGSGSLVSGGLGNFISFTPGIGQLNVRSEYLSLSGSGLHLKSSGSAGGNYLRLGTVIGALASVTSSQGSGFYADGAGNLFIGSGSVSAGGNYILFDQANERLYIRSNYLNIGSDGLMIQATGSGAGNYIRLGNVVGAVASVSQSQGSGLYVDGAGNFFLGSGSLLNGGLGSFISYTPDNISGSKLNIRSQFLAISASGLFMAASGSAGSAAALRIGNIVGAITSISASGGSGFYADGAGNFFVGDGNVASHTGNWIFFTPSPSRINMRAELFTLSSSGLFLKASGSAGGNAIRLGTPGTAVAAITASSGAGFYADGAGNFFVGTGSLAAGLGSYMFFDATNRRIMMRSQHFVLSSSNVFIIASGSGAGNAIRLGTVGSALASISGSSGAGFYADGGGNFFVGSGSLANSSGSFISYTPAANNDGILVLRSKNFFLSASGLLMNSSDQAFGSDSRIALGLASALNTGAGIYMDSQGRFRAGTATGNRIQYDGSSVLVQVSDISVISTNFLLITSASKFGLGPNKNEILLDGSPSESYIRVGTANNAGGNISGTGVFLSGSGDFYVGKTGASSIFFNPSTGDMSLNKVAITGVGTLAIPILSATSSFTSPTVTIKSGSDPTRMTLDRLSGFSYFSGSDTIFSTKPYSVSVVLGGSLILGNRNITKTGVATATVSAGSGFVYDVGTTTGEFFITGSSAHPFPAVGNEYTVKIASSAVLVDDLVTQPDYIGCQLVADIYYKRHTDAEYTLYAAEVMLIDYEGLIATSKTGFRDYSFNINDVLPTTTLSFKMTVKGRIATSKVFSGGPWNGTISFGRGITTTPTTAASASFTYQSSSAGQSYQHNRDGVFIQGRKSGSIYEPHIHFEPLTTDISPTASVAGDLWFESSSRAFIQGVGPGQHMPIPQTQIASIQNLPNGYQLCGTSIERELSGSIISCSEGQVYEFDHMIRFLRNSSLGASTSVYAFISASVGITPGTFKAGWHQTAITGAINATINPDHIEHRILNQSTAFSTTAITITTTGHYADYTLRGIASSTQKGTIAVYTSQNSTGGMVACLSESIFKWTRVPITKLEQSP